jgi:hypothetical protein
MSYSCAKWKARLSMLAQFQMDSTQTFRWLHTAPLTAIDQQTTGHVKSRPSTSANREDMILTGVNHIVGTAVDAAARVTQACFLIPTWKRRTSDQSAARASGTLGQRVADQTVLQQCRRKTVVSTGL